MIGRNNLAQLVHVTPTMPLLRLPVAFALAGLLAAPAFADPITSLYNTGVDDSGNPLANGTIGDPHYTLTPIGAATGSTSVIRVLTSAGGYPVGPWLGDDSVSAWIGPDNDSSADGPVGEYIYTTTFSLLGDNLGSVQIEGQLSEDNDLDNIIINGHSLGIGNGNGFESWTPFAVDQTDAAGDFVDGMNTLQFIVYNGGGPTGFRTEFTTAQANPISSVPDSGLGFGFSALVLALVLGASPQLNWRPLALRYR
jgi:hypothetical protein